MKYELPQRGAITKSISKVFLLMPIFVNQCALELEAGKNDRNIDHVIEWGNLYSVNFAHTVILHFIMLYTV